MKLRKLSTIIVLITILAGLVTAAPNADMETYLIGFEPGHGVDVADQVRQHGGDIAHEYAFNVIAIDLPADADRAVAALENRPDVRYVEADGMMYAHGQAATVAPGTLATAGTTDQTTPWGVDRIGADAAHDTDTGSGVGIAVLDTGIDPEHETLEVAGGKAFVNCRPGGWCAERWDDDHGHGTHVAGTAAAQDNGIGVLGTAPDASLYAVKVLDRDGGGTWSNVAAGIEWAADENIEVISMSLGGGHSNTVQDAVEYAYGEGSLLVASAGNDYGDDVNYPAAYSEVIAVSATDENDDIAEFSSLGEAVELTAPGVSILSTLPNDDYGSASGTSMSAPHVSGVAALAWSQLGDADNVEVRAHLQDTAEDIGLSDTEQGYGLVDALAAVDVEETTGALEGTVTDEAGNALEGATVELNGEEATTDANGFYRFDEVATGDYDVTASRDGYTSETHTVTIDEDETTTQTFTLTQLYTVNGTVTDADSDDAIADAAVTIDGTDHATTTDVNGEYTIDGVENGTYDLTVSKDGYYAEEQSVVVEEDVTVDVALNAIPTYTVSGTVTDGENNPIEGATVTNEETGETVTTDENGDYSFTDVEEGTYTLTASAEGYVSASQKVSVTEDVTNADFQLAEVEESAPVIDTFDVDNNSNPQWARADVQWAVSDDGGNLAEVRLDVYDSNGNHVDSEVWDVSGGDTSGEYEFRERNGHGDYTFVLTVTDENENETEQAESVTLER